MNKTHKFYLVHRYYHHILTTNLNKVKYYKDNIELIYQYCIHMKYQNH